MLLLSQGPRHDVEEDMAEVAIRQVSWQPTAWCTSTCLCIIPVVPVALRWRSCWRKSVRLSPMACHGCSVTTTPGTSLARTFAHIMRRALIWNLEFDVPYAFKLRPCGRLPTSAPMALCTARNLQKSWRGSVSRTVTSISLCPSCFWLFNQGQLGPNPGVRWDNPSAKVAAYAREKLQHAPGLHFFGLPEWWVTGCPTRHDRRQDFKHTLFWSGEEFGWPLWMAKWESQVQPPTLLQLPPLTSWTSDACCPRLFDAWRLSDACRANLFWQKDCVLLWKSSLASRNRLSWKMICAAYSDGDKEIKISLQKHVWVTRGLFFPTDGRSQLLSLAIEQASFCQAFAWCLLSVVCCYSCLLLIDWEVKAWTVSTPLFSNVSKTVQAQSVYWCVFWIFIPGQIFKSLFLIANTNTV